MAFDDGTPLDAAKLQALETELNNLKASIPRIGSSTVNIDASTTNNQTVVQSQIVCGETTSAFKVGPKKEQSFPINLTGVTSTPLSVILSPIKTSGSLKDVTWHISGPLGKTINVKVYNGYTSEQQVRFTWIAICGNK